LRSRKGPSCKIEGKNQTVEDGMRRKRDQNKKEGGGKGEKRRSLDPKLSDVQDMKSLGQTGGGTQM